jgi:hypothetical protein
VIFALTTFQNVAVGVIVLGPIAGFFLHEHVGNAIKMRRDRREFEIKRIVREEVARELDRERESP